MNLQLFSAAPSLFHCCCWQLSFHCKIIKNVSSITGSSAMNKLRQSFRRKKDVYVPESSRPHQWQTDEEAVRTGKCSFAVKVTLPHTHTHTHLRTPHFRHRNGVQGWPHFDAFLPLRNFFIPPSSPRTRLVINHNHSESLSTVFI